MERTFSMILVYFFAFVGAIFFVDSCYAAITYIPAATITLTGANNEVFFDVEDDIVNAGTSLSGPRLSTLTKTFSGAFYLSGAGWIDLGAPGYGVLLDCGAQALDALSSPCLLTGTGYGELIGEVIFDTNVKYHPESGLLSGTAGTYVGTYDLSGVVLPLLPSVFFEGTGTTAQNAVALSISGSSIYGEGPWTIAFTPLTTLETRNIAPNPNFTVDLSLAADYDVEITDPQGSKTQFVYHVSHDIPSFSLFLGPNFRNDFCTLSPAHAFCQDGATQKPSEFHGLSPVKVANGNDPYAITISFRDKYGNDIRDGDVSLMYKDTIRTFQVNPLEYLNFDDYCVRNIDNYCALITGGSLLSNDDGTPDMSHVPVLGGISSMIASRAPTSASDTLTLSGISYTDINGMDYDILQPALTAPISFSPWYTTSLSNGTIMVGETTDFTPNLTNTTPAVLPDTILGIYHIDIGTNTLASYTNFLGENIACTKYIGEAGAGVCDWVHSPDSSIISLWGTAFSGAYTPYAGQPPPENVSYRSYVRYTQGGTTVIYPSQGASLGIASAGIEYFKVLGQDTTPYSGVGVDNSVAAAEWNTIKKNVSLKSRGRDPSTGYADVDYIIHTGSIIVTNDDIHGALGKHVIVALGGDITVTTDIQNGDTPTVLIALMDKSGNGGDIIIDSSVKDLSVSLFAEKSIQSSGNNQLTIFGNVFSHNTLSNVKCPYYVTGVCDPKLYNLENIRADYLTLTPKTGHTSATARASDYPNIPLIIEYDGRLLQHPPSLLAK